MVMNRTYFSILLLGLLALLASPLDLPGQVPDPEAAIYRAKAVRKAAEYTKVYTADSLTGARYLSRETYFHADGMPEKVLSYEASGRKDLEITYVYEAGLLAQETWTWWWEDGTHSVEGYIYLYDDAGNLTREQAFMGDQFTEWEEYEYLEGTLFAAKCFDAGGEADSSVKYTYDAEGQLIQALFYTENGSLLTRLRHTYDAQGLRVRTQTDTFEAGNLRSYVTLYMREARGVLTKVITQSMEGERLNERVYERAESGLLLKVQARDVAAGERQVLEYEYETY